MEPTRLAERRLVHTAARRASGRILLRIKRTNLVLDPELLDQATTVLGVKTYSATINLALAEVLRFARFRSYPSSLAVGFGREVSRKCARTGWKGALTLNVQCEAADEVGRRVRLDRIVE